MRNTIEILFGPGIEGTTEQAWVKAGVSPEQGGYDVYVDTATIRRKGDTVKMWHLHDFGQPQESHGKTYLSTKNWVEYDLRDPKTTRRRTLYFSWHAGRMGTGNAVLRVDEHSPWREVRPGSVAALLSGIAAGAVGR